jgi:poly-gamma-glutamate capsule biosynthesis protein CapA/YwtB (metallophosphatase superfamily)
MNKVRMIRKGFQFGSLFCLVALTLLWMSCESGNAPTNVQSSTLVAINDTIPTQDTSLADTIKVSVQPANYTIIGVGDMMLGTNYPSASYLPPKGGSTMLADVKDLLKSADITFGNLEGTILDSGGKAKQCRNPSACYVFRSPESYVTHFVDAGFDFLSIANNHSGDFGQTGRSKTKEVLDKAEIAYAGLAGTDEYAIVEKDGMTYGMCAFSPNWGTCSIHDLSKARQIVKKLDEQCDVVIVSFHGGAEGEKHQHVPKRKETYYGENRGDVHQFSHTVIDAGADIVFGHGPHVTRAMELYKDRLICYSLGNFCTYGRFNLRGAAGYAPIVAVTVDEKGAFVGGKVTPIYQQKAHGPKIDPQNRAITKLIELTKSDFPNTSLQINKDGTLTQN